MQCFHYYQQFVNEVDVMRVKFKVTCLVCQWLSGQVPLYLADDCCLVSDSNRRSLWSADVPTCVVPRTLSSYGDRTFAATGPRLWNSLPVQLRNPDITYGLFRWQLKGHLFWEAWTRRSVTSDMRHLRKTLTYLLKASYINITVKYFTRVKIVSCFCLHAELFKGFLIMLISMDVWRLTFI